MIDKQTENLIKERADIVEVVSDYVHLIRRGSNFMGLCPFHNERTPSFSVNRRKNFCYCFSCKKGGSPVNFLMEKEGVSYHDALLMLAKKYGIEVNEREMTDEERQRQNERESLIVANTWALKQMEDTLWNTDGGRDIGMSYFRQRGVTDEALKAFRLGYAADRATDLVERAGRDGYSLDLLHTLGLVGYSHEGHRPYDRFRGRVIFPIFNIAGIPIAFGGRDIKGTSPAKYINSPETPLYTKSNELYGIFQAKGEIRRQDCCYLVEGYMDVIGMWQSGIQNVVASSGTALTEGQIALIHRLTRNIVLIYDGDEAGIKASLRGIDMLLQQGMKVRVVLLPDGHDPDSFAKANTAEEFRSYINGHSTDIIEFKTGVLMERGGHDPASRAAAIRSIIESIACIPDAIERMVYTRECSNRLEADPDTVMAEVEREFRRRSQTAYARQKNSEQQKPVQTPSTQSSQSSPSTQSTPSFQKTPGAPKRPAFSLEPLEREALRYAVNYGMVDFCEGVDVEGKTFNMSVADFIREDIGADGVAFSVEPYGRIFDMITEMRPRFEDDYARHYQTLEGEIEAMRREEFDKIGAEGLDSDAIQVRERELETRLEKHLETELRDYVTGYISRELASHEDDDVRKTVTSLISTPHVLSKIFSRNGAVATEFDRLAELVPRALNEWKTALLEKKIAEARKQLAEASATDDTESIASLQSEIAELLASRSDAARTIGERIIAPIQITTR